jgi:hypothetical protein
MISIVQNFICTDEKRLEVVLDNLPALGEAFKDYEFYVNFNDTVNLDIVRDAYYKNIEKLNFYNNLEKQWAEVTLAMLNGVKTPYVLYICEDQVVHFNSDDLRNILDEVKELDIDYVNLTKISKYSKDTFSGYNNCKYGYSYLGKDSPPTRLSLDCLVKTAFWKERYVDFIINKQNCPHNIPYPYENIPNYFEGYCDYSLGARSFSNLKCYIPKQIMFIEYNDSLEKVTYI